MKILACFVPALALAACLVTPHAEACGPLTAEDFAARVVNQNFVAVNDHDKDRVLKLWTPGATVITRGQSASDPVTVDPVERAAPRWIAVKTPTTFRIDSVRADEDIAIVRARVESAGKSFDERIVVGRVGGVWKILGKTSAPAPAVEKAKA